MSRIPIVPVPALLRHVVRHKDAPLPRLVWWIKLVHLASEKGRRYEHASLGKNGIPTPRYFAFVYDAECHEAMVQRTRAWSRLMAAELENVMNALKEAVDRACDAQVDPSPSLSVVASEVTLTTKRPLLQSNGPPDASINEAPPPNILSSLLNADALSVHASASTPLLAPEPVGDVNMSVTTLTAAALQTAATTPTLARAPSGSGDPSKLAWKASKRQREEDISDAAFGMGISVGFAPTSRPATKPRIAPPPLTASGAPVGTPASVSGQTTPIHAPPRLLAPGNGISRVPGGGRSPQVPGPFSSTGSGVGAAVLPPQARLGTSVAGGDVLYSGAFVTPGKPASPPAETADAIISSIHVNKAVVRARRPSTDADGLRQRSRALLNDVASRGKEWLFLARLASFQIDVGIVCAGDVALALIHCVTVPVCPAFSGGGGGGGDASDPSQLSRWRPCLIALTALQSYMSVITASSLLSRQLLLRCVEVLSKAATQSPRPSSAATTAPESRSASQVGVTPLDATPTAAMDGDVELLLGPCLAAVRAAATNCVATIAVCCPRIMSCACYASNPHAGYSVDPLGCGGIVHWKPGVIRCLCEASPSLKACVKSALLATASSLETCSSSISVDALMRDASPQVHHAHVLGVPSGLQLPLWMLPFSAHFLRCRVSEAAWAVHGHDVAILRALQAALRWHCQCLCQQSTWMAYLSGCGDVTTADVFDNTDLVTPVLAAAVPECVRLQVESYAVAVLGRLVAVGASEVSAVLVSGMVADCGARIEEINKQCGALAPLLCELCVPQCCGDAFRDFVEGVMRRVAGAAASASLALHPCDECAAGGPRGTSVVEVQALRHPRLFSVLERLPHLSCANDCVLPLLDALASPGTAISPDSIPQLCQLLAHVVPNGSVSLDPLDRCVTALAACAAAPQLPSPLTTHAVAAVSALALRQLGTGLSSSTALAVEVVHACVPAVLPLFKLSLSLPCSCPTSCSSTSPVASCSSTPSLSVGGVVSCLCCNSAAVGEVDGCGVCLLRQAAGRVVEVSCYSGNAAFWCYAFTVLVLHVTDHLGGSCASILCVRRQLLAAPAAVGHLCTVHPGNLRQPALAAATCKCSASERGDGSRERVHPDASLRCR